MNPQQELAAQDLTTIHSSKVAPPLIVIDLGTVVFGMAVKDHVVVEVPPIAQECLGWSEGKAIRHYEMRGATIRRYPGLRG